MLSSITLKHIKDFQGIFIVNFFEHFIGKVNTINHPAPLYVMTSRWVEIFVVRFKEAVVNTVCLGIACCICTEENTLLIFYKEFSGGVRLTAQFADSCIDINKEIRVTFEPHSNSV